MSDWKNQLWYGDNLEVLRENIPTNSVDLIYLDPPFNSNRSYNVLFKNRSGDDAQAQIEAFDDTWTWSQESEAQYAELVRGSAPIAVANAIQAMRSLLGDNDVLAYLVMMAARLVELERVLKKTGSIYLHCDDAASHYLKVLMDATFGADAFRNAITWRRVSPGTKSTRDRWGRIGDDILYYAYPKAVFNPQHGPHDPDYVSSKYVYDDEDGRGLYRTDNLTAPKPAKDGTSVKPWRGIDVLSKGLGWSVPRHSVRRLREETNIDLNDGELSTQDKLDTLDEHNFIYWPAKEGGMPQRKQYLADMPGPTLGDIWTDIDAINSQAKERLGYPTQKPVQLLERIIDASSNPGDLVLDPFCGCGTTVDAAQKLGRRWIGVDITYLSVDLMQKRLESSYGSSARDSYRVYGIPHDLSGAAALFRSNPFDFERWAVSLVDGQPNEKQVGDQGVDGLIRFPIDNDNAVGRCIVSVKGGQQINPAMVRDLIGTVDGQHAEMGVLVLMRPPTRGMSDAAKKSGTYVWPVSGRPYPRVQIITIAEILKSKKVDMPTPFLPYVQAKKYGGHQLSVFET